MKHTISFSNYQQNPRRINIKSTTSLYATHGYAVEKALTPAPTSADLTDLPADLIQRINTAAKGATSKKLLDLMEQIPL